ncbi:PREDICTED: uncharacterized protein LOC109164752 [Ipomoea nil]|uniref:uncharacterized protein LOC109164752 n=1 Tax=Ipomoea nil TaxID=35883 RepID=UPI0009012388|nr:PREDICTED: uncharacterized protein LOC109164752 [Ipomoea nil]
MSLTEFQRLEECLNRIEAQEDAYWRQRAKQHWLKDADANTKFYHRYASHRKKKNTIVKIMNDSRDWVEGEAMRNIILNYYRNIFSSGSPNDNGEFFGNIGSRVTQVQNETLLRPFDVTEVKNALFSMFPDSTRTGWNESGLNDTNIILIPKKKTPELVSDYRPIALSNMIYRIMAKVIAARMKPLMGDIISDTQSAFIFDILITDNILIAAEVDDSLLFFRASAQEAGVVKQCLSVYEEMSGQAVNYYKSSICYSKNTRDEDREEVASILGVVQAPNFGKYLGLPSFVGRNRKAAFSYIEDKIKQRIGSWNKKLLSQAAIERTMNRYWWRSKDDQGIHWKAWDKLCIPKKYGGLGFKELCAFNLAMLGKQAWRLLTKPESLVSRIFKSRYYPKGSFFHACLGNNPSFCWRSIMAAQELICGGVRRRIGNGRATLIWDHPWLRDENNAKIITEKPPQLAQTTVMGLMDQETGSWDHGILTDIFIPADVTQILKILVSPDYEDVWYWYEDITV